MNWIAAGLYLVLLVLLAVHRAGFLRDEAADRRRMLERIYQADAANRR